jgi:hypothetical protein
MQPKHYNHAQRQEAAGNRLSELGLLLGGG